MRRASALIAPSEFVTTLSRRSGYVTGAPCAGEKRHLNVPAGVDCTSHIEVLSTPVPLGPDRDFWKRFGLWLHTTMLQNDGFRIVEVVFTHVGDQLLVQKALTGSASMASSN